GDEEATEGLLTCLAKGASRGVRIWDDSLAGADALAVARVLAEAVRREQPDLVLCGVQSSDAVNSATGIGLAGFLDLPHVAVVRAISSEEGSLVVERELEGGLVEVVRVRLPALLTVQTGINEPRYANLRAIKQAREKPRDVLLELIGAARTLGPAPLSVAVVDHDPSRYRDRLAVDGVDAVLAVKTPSEQFEPHVAQRAVEALIEQEQPSLVVLGHTIDSL